MTDKVAGPDGSGLSDQLGLVVNRALFADECQRLAEWALIGPVQRAALESFAGRLLAAERERCETLRTVTGQVLRDMQAQGVLLEWQTLLDEALRA